MRRGPWVIGWEDLTPSWIVIWNSLVVSEAEKAKAKDMLPVAKFPTSELVVEQWPVRIHRHKWCSPNGFFPIDDDGEWHTHFEKIAGPCNTTVAYFRPARCPECEAGKHRNCTNEAMTEDGKIVPCPCATTGHGGA